MAKSNLVCSNYKEIIHSLRMMKETDNRQIVGAEILQMIDGFLPNVKNSYKERLAMAIYEKINDKIKCST